MKEYIRKRVLDICNHIIETKHTVRQTATVFGVSKSTVHKDLPKVNGEECSEFNSDNGVWIFHTPFIYASKNVELCDLLM
ncbi:hypothetical protein SCACP_32950 [Sporomusa carbonis]|uniref:sporulation transcriptional regulator SpoIIID n=1 Tax=Sporomusa carbonis TaxID=3076075 RepID=UPI003A615BD2